MTSSEKPLPSILSVNHSTSKLLLANTWSVLYILDNGRMALHRNFCLVLCKGMEEIRKLIPHIQLKSCGVTSECTSELENLFEAGTSYLPESNWLSCNKTFGALTFGSYIVTFMETIVQQIRFKLNTHYEYSSYCWCLPRATTSLTNFIEPKTSLRILLLCWNRIAFGFQLCGDNNII